MKALVYHGPGKKAWEDVPEPALSADTDAIVRVDAVTICGTDLHILKGDVPTVTDGRILGHEAVGTVEADRRRGEGRSRSGDRVLVSCISSCGACRFCREGRYGQCTRRRRLDPRPHDRRHAGRVRAGSVRGHLDLPGPGGVSDEELLMLADILPTGYEVGVLNGAVQPGDVVAVVGAGPIGLAAIMRRRLFCPSHSRRDRHGRHPPGRGQAVRRRRRRQQRAARTRSAVVRDSPAGLAPTSRSRRSGYRRPSSCAADLIRPGGRVANIGVHGKPATLHLEELWIRDVTITTGLVDTYSTPTLLRLLTSHQVDAQPLRHAPFRARRLHRGLRRLLPRRGHRRAEGRHQPTQLTERTIRSLPWSPVARQSAEGGRAPTIRVLMATTAIPAPRAGARPPAAPTGRRQPVTAAGMTSRSPYSSRRPSPPGGLTTTLLPVGRLGRQTARGDVATRTTAARTPGPGPVADKPLRGSQSCVEEPL